MNFGLGVGVGRIPEEIGVIEEDRVMGNVGHLKGAERQRIVHAADGGRVFRQHLAGDVERFDRPPRFGNRHRGGLRRRIVVNVRRL